MSVLAALRRLAETTPDETIASHAWRALGRCGRADAGEASFRRLASLGVTWVSIHTWDPLQRGLDEPVFAQPDRHFGFRDFKFLLDSP